MLHAVRNIESENAIPRARVRRELWLDMAALRSFVTELRALPGEGVT